MCAPEPISLSLIITAFLGICVFIFSAWKLKNSFKIIGLVLGVSLFVFSSYAPSIEKYITAPGRSIQINENVKQFISDKNWRSNTYCGGSFYTFKSDGSYIHYRMSDVLEGHTVGTWEYNSVGFWRGEIILKSPPSKDSVFGYSTQGERIVKIWVLGKYLFIDGQSYSDRF